jgi:hypothetical protein
VIFCWKRDEATTLAEAIGSTENISTTGIAFLTEAVIEVGSYLSLNLHLRSAGNGGRSILLHAEGTVLRVEAVGKRSRIAAEIRIHEDFEEGFSVSSTIQ